jgi:hypothetical protein
VVLSASTLRRTRAAEATQVLPEGSWIAVTVTDWIYDHVVPGPQALRAVHWCHRPRRIIEPGTNIVPLIDLMLESA